MNNFPLLVRYNLTAQIEVIARPEDIRAGQTFRVIATNFDVNKLIVVLQTIADDCARTVGLGMSGVGVRDIEHRCRKVLNPDLF